MTLISSTTSLVLDLPPSCIAFCPTQPQYFVVGTYFLHPQEDKTTTPEASEDDVGDGKDDGARGNAQQRRSGSLTAYRLDGDSIEAVTKEATPDFAVLDMQWTPRAAAADPVLAVATSTGSLAFYRLDAGRAGAGAELRPTCAAKRVSDPSVLVLSLCWHPTRARVLGATLSDGGVALCESTEGELWSPTVAAPVRVTVVQEHGLEAWCMAFTRGRRAGVGVLSGGDDMVLQRSTSTDDVRGLESLWQDRRIHQAGVTAILPLGSSDLVVTGSYDDRIRLISAPPTGRRRVLAELDLGGGVWRLKVLKEEYGRADATPAADRSSSSATSENDTRCVIILASCMHAGTRIVRLRRDGDDADEATSWSLDVLAQFEEHRSMNYASDVQPADGSETTAATIVSTSFYDRLLCLWRFDIGQAHGGA